MRLLSAGLFVGAILVSATAAGAQDIDWEKVDAALGRKGAVSADVHRYGFPRSDLTVKLDGVTPSRRSRSAAGLRSSPCTAR